MFKEHHLNLEVGMNYVLFFGFTITLNTQIAFKCFRAIKFMQKNGNIQYNVKLEIYR